MQNTCEIKGCPIAKKMKIKKAEECLNYVESWWTPENKKQPIVVKDCSPKRTFIMIQELYNRLIGVQKQQDELSKEYEKQHLVMSLLTDNIQMNLKRILPQVELIEEDRKERKLLLTK